MSSALNRSIAMRDVGGTTWLETACDRLRHHPVFQDTAKTDVRSATLIQETRATCNAMVWDKKP